jgi:murein DD-endopeptidase MepM/ murein hydrolase activator NlpD
MNFRFPLPEKILTSPFGERVHPVTGERSFHGGADYAAELGTPVTSPFKGAVSATGSDDRSGTFLILERPDGWTVSFSHLDAREVSVHQEVSSGELVAFTGASGRVTGPHVHIRVKDPAGVDVDPEAVWKKGLNGGTVVAALLAAGAILA